MDNPTNRVAPRVIALVIAITNILSFSFGIAAAARFAAPEPSTEPLAEKAVATSSPAAHRLGKHASHAAAAPRAKASPAPHVAAAPAQETRSPIEGKGMWIWQFDKVGRGDPRAIVRAAVSRGLSHLYVRAGSSKVGLSGWPDIVRILPIAHEAGLKVIAWDFPYLYNGRIDVRRARYVMTHSVHGHYVDGFAADVETRSEGTQLSGARAKQYAQGLRRALPHSYLILVPPRPNSFTLKFYPYHVTVPYFDAVAPMVYWGRFRADTVVRESIRYLRRFGKPVAPIGQAFDMGPEGGPKGAPSAGTLVLFMNVARREGAVGVSFWSWQHTPPHLWRAIDGYGWPAKSGPA
jgi:hypothetical protein